MFGGLGAPRSFVGLLAVVVALGSAAPAHAGWVVLFGKNGYEVSADAPDDLKAALAKVKRTGKEIRCVAFTPAGGWAILHGKNDATTSNIPANAAEHLQKLAKAGKSLRSIAFGDKDSWVILYDENSYQAHNVGAPLEKKLAEVLNQNKSIQSISLTTGERWAIAYDQGKWWYTWNAPDDLFKNMENLAAAKAKFRNVIVAPTGGWLVLHGANEVATGSLPDDAVEAVRAAAKKGLHSAAFFEPQGEGATTRDEPSNPPPTLPPPGMSGIFRE